MHIALTWCAINAVAKIKGPVAWAAAQRAKVPGATCISDSKLKGVNSEAVFIIYSEDRLNVPVRKEDFVNPVIIAINCQSRKVEATPLAFCDPECRFTA